jgi:NADPH-dependent 2,4-dienoyl-CoA reductase/sulfur reductase-like enzyme
MSESVALSVDGRPVAVHRGITVAAALENAGQRALRRSVSGQPRGVLCAMGICFECRVTIDGDSHRRACMETVREGMEIHTRYEEFRVSSSELRVERLECDVAVVGGGPAGIAAACRAAECEARTVLLDDGAEPGGQIHRHLPGHDAPPGARAWLARLARSGARLLRRAAVYDAAREPEAWRMFARTPEGRIEVRARSIVLATGARELFLPFPGWTLPGVLGAGGAQALWKSGASMHGRTAVVAGSGPLLLPVAASLAKAGARVALVAEQAGLPALCTFSAGLLRSPRKLLEAARYRRGFAATQYRIGAWVAEARGRESVESVIVADVPGRRVEVPCDLAAVAYGLVPNTELARVLGCEVDLGRVAVGARQETSVPGVFCAGEPCGVAGIDGALAEGQLAGLAAAGRRPEDFWDSRRLLRAREQSRRFAASLAGTFRPRPELARLAGPDTLLCRCEDVSRGRVEACASAREAKLATRAGMGACQGRVCGPGLEFLFGWDSDTVRSPIQPVAVGDLAPEEEA